MHVEILTRCLLVPQVMPNSCPVLRCMSCHAVVCLGRRLFIDSYCTCRTIWRASSTWAGRPSGRS